MVEDEKTRKRRDSFYMLFGYEGDFSDLKKTPADRHDHQDDNDDNYSEYQEF